MTVRSVIISSNHFYLIVFFFMHTYTHFFYVQRLFNLFYQVFPYSDQSKILPHQIQRLNGKCENRQTSLDYIKVECYYY